MKPSSITMANFILSLLYGTYGVFLYLQVGTETGMNFDIAILSCIATIVVGMFFVNFENRPFLYPFAFLFTVFGIFSFLETMWIEGVIVTIAALFLSGSVVPKGGYSSGLERTAFSYTEEEMFFISIPVVGIFVALWMTYRQLR